MKKQHEESLAKQVEISQDQAKTNVRIVALLEMMKKQHQS